MFNALNNNNLGATIDAVTCIALNVSIDAKGEYKIAKRLQRVTIANNGATAEKREIMDLEVHGLKGCAPAITLNGLPLSSDQCLVGIDGVVTILDVDRNVVDRVQVPPFALPRASTEGWYGNHMSGKFPKGYNAAATCATTGGCIIA